MAHYDNFLKRDSGISKVGRWMVDRKNEEFLKLISYYHPKKLQKLKILEIGPGKGDMAKKCMEKNLDYTAIEANKTMSNNLKSKGIKVYNKTVPPINIKGNFDVIFMNQVFEHMENRTEALTLFEECKNYLNEKGLLIISVPDIRYWKEDFFASDYTHSFPLSLYSLRQIYTDFGFEIKYANVRTLIFKGKFFARSIKILTGFLYKLGIFRIIFKQKAYKIKNQGNASCIVIGKCQKVWTG
ncbi:MAG: class I SAM-dependent methyltransferase [Candidatus Woesearchaeota archaeon]